MFYKRQDNILLNALQFINIKSADTRAAGIGTKAKEDALLKNDLSEENLGMKKSSVDFGNECSVEESELKNIEYT